MTKKALKIIEELNLMFPNAKGELDHNNNFELLVAVVLSAQTTDVAVNKITPDLFLNYKTPYELKEAKISDVEKKLKSIGLYKTKAKNIIALSKILVDDFKGEIPNNLEDLMLLPGVGRKTANVVLSNAFGIPAIAVDTHVYRVSHRLGISSGKTPYDVEQDLMKTFDEQYWIRLHHQLIFFGRYHCKAQKPNCKECPLRDICKYENKL